MERSEEELGKEQKGASKLSSGTQSGEINLIYLEIFTIYLEIVWTPNILLFRCSDDNTPVGK